MRVLMINVVCGIRSTGRICTDLATALEMQGHEVKIAYGRENVPEQFRKYAVRIGSDLDVKIHGAKARLFDDAGFASKRATIKFIQWVKEYNPDVIHLHNIHGYYINVTVLFDYLRTCGKKIIWTMHDCWAFTGHCSHFTIVNCSKWREGCNHCQQTKEYPKSITDRAKRNWFKKKELFTSVTEMTVVTPSEWLKDIVEKSFLGKYKVKSIPNGIDLELFRFRSSDFKKIHGIEDKKIILGCATAWSEQKGLKEFIKLSDILGRSYKIVLVGMTDEQISNLPQNILGVPQTNSIKELAEIYSAADVFVNAGKEETMGLTTVEAMACGTPVVVSNLTAVPEVVRDTGGLVVHELTPENIAEAIHNIFNLQLNPRRNAEEYDKNKQYQKYIKLYID